MFEICPDYLIGQYDDVDCLHERAAFQGMFSIAGYYHCPDCKLKFNPQEFQVKHYGHGTIDQIYDYIDEYLLAGKFDKINDLLERHLMIDTDGVLAILTITLAAKDKLPSREGYFERAKEFLMRRDCWEDNLLSGLN